MAILTFNIAYDSGIFAQERHPIQMLGLYLLLAHTGCRAGELVGNEKKPLSGQDRILNEILSQETVGHGCPRALYYRGFQLMVVRHPMLVRLLSLS